MKPIKLSLKEKLSFLGRFDVFDERGNVLYKAKEEFAWGHCLTVFDASGKEVALLKENLSLPSSYEVALNGESGGVIQEGFTFVLTLGWQEKGLLLKGDISGFSFLILSENAGKIAVLKQQVFAWTKAFTFYVKKEEQILPCVLLLLALCLTKSKRDRQYS